LSSSMGDDTALIPVGKIIATHGIKGQVKVYSYSGNIDSLRSAINVTIRGAGGSLTTVGVEKIAPHSGGFILGFTGFNEINEVQALIGSEICLLQSQLPELDEGEYYWRDLLGLKVVTDQGIEIGNVADIFETGSSDIYVVRGASKEYLIPAIADVISEIDIPGGRIVITPLDGLLEL